MSPFFSRAGTRSSVSEEQLPSLCVLQERGGCSFPRDGKWWSRESMPASRGGRTRLGQTDPLLWKRRIGTTEGEPQPCCTCNPRKLDPGDLSSVTWLFGHSRLLLPLLQ
ncbi:uncharacterized protein M6G45_015136 isoform 1-T1 [Spheniscus humboldti]